MHSSVEPSAGGKPNTRSFSDILKGSSSSFNPKPSGHFRGKPAVTFSDEDIKKYSAPFHFTLIGKFSSGRPPMDHLRKCFHSIGFSGNFTLGLIDSRHILIRFDLQEDYLRCWKRGFWSFESCVMRIIKWHPNFSVDSESPLVPVWLNLPLLPIHLYNKEALFSIARLIGEPLKIDAATEALSRPSQARVCIELDLMKERCDEVHITLGSFSYWQKIEFENIPHYCSICRKIGHNKEACRKNEPRKPGTSSQPGTKNTQEPPKVAARQEYRPIQKEIIQPPEQSEAQNNEAKTEESAPIPSLPANPQEASPTVNSAPPLPTAIVQENLNMSFISETLLPEIPAPQINVTNTSADFENLHTLVPEPSLAVLHPAPLIPTLDPGDLQHPEQDSASNTASLQHISNPPESLRQNEEPNISTENVLELGEIPNSSLPYASDSEVSHNQEDDQKEINQLPPDNSSAHPNDLPSSSNAIQNRGKLKKKPQNQHERVTTRQAGRGLTNSLP